MSDNLPPIPAKRYFTIGEVAELCGVKQHVDFVLCHFNFSVCVGRGAWPRCFILRPR